MLMRIRLPHLKHDKIISSRTAPKSSFSPGEVCESDASEIEQRAPLKRADCTGKAVRWKPLLNATT